MKRLLYVFFNLFVLTKSVNVRPRKCCLEPQVFDLGLRNCSAVQETQQEAYLNALLLTATDINFTIYSTDNFTFSKTNFVRTHVCSETQRYINSEDDESSPEWVLFSDEDIALLTEEQRVIDSNFCVDRGFSGGRYRGSVLVHCFSWEQVCSENLCIPTPCSEGLVYNSSISSCTVPHSSEEKTLIKFNILPPSGDDGKNSSKVIFKVSTLKCPYHLYSDEEEEYSIDENGVLHIANGNFDNNKYSIYREESLDEETGTFKYVTRIQTCAEKIGHKGFLTYSRYVWTMFLAVCQFLSMIFLLLLIGYLIKTNRRKLFGILTLCMTTSLFFFYLFLTATQLLPAKVFNSLPKLCLFLGFGVQFSYQTAIFWLNTMCFDIWCTFRYIRRSSEIEPPGWKKPIFKLYCLYAWGVPTIISATTITMNSLSKYLPKNIVTPGIGDSACFFSTDEAKLFYFHLINFIVIIANIGFFAGSSWNLLCGVWADGGEDSLIRKQNRLRHKAVFKLFFAMGISWLAEVVSWIIGWTVGTHSSSVVVAGSAFFDMVNALQGFTIFAVIVFDSANIIKIKEFLRSRGIGKSEQNYPSSGASFSSFGGPKIKMNRKQTPPTQQEILEMESK